MKAVERAYYNLEFHVTNGDELEKMSARTKNALVKMIDNEIKEYAERKETVTCSLDFKSYIPTLEKMRAVIA